MIVDNANPKSNVVHVTDSTWDNEVIKASMEKPVFVDFWAEWCGPCKAFEPILDRVANDMGDKIKFTKINVDENSKIPQEFGIMAIPTLIIVNKGEKILQQSGLLAEGAFRELLNSIINDGK